jgi:predicted RNA-binding protein with PIN domain
MILVDGHNVIGQMPGLALDDPDDEEKLLVRLRSYRARAGVEMVVYFDPGLCYSPPTRRSEPGITVRCAGSGQQADDLMVQDILHHAHPRELVVVTSDRAIREVARVRGCRILDSAAFVAALKSPVRRKPRRVRVRARGSDAPALSADEVREWLRLFEGSSSTDRAGPDRRHNGQSGCALDSGD